MIFVKYNHRLVRLSLIVELDVLNHTMYDVTFLQKIEPKMLCHSWLVRTKHFQICRRIKWSREDVPVVHEGSWKIRLSESFQTRFEKRTK